MTHVDEAVHGKVLEVHLHGKLTSEDYARFAPETEELIRQHGRIRILAVLDDFHGWNVGALWQDIRWDVRHFRHVERIAVVGEKKWHRWMVGFCKPFTFAEVRYFEHEDLDEARHWTEAN